MLHSEGLTLQPDYGNSGLEREMCQRLEGVGIEIGAGPACLNRWNNQSEARAILRLGLLYGKQ